MPVRGSSRSAPSAACWRPPWGMLIGGRVVTGVGAGLVIVSEFVAIGRVFPTTLRPRVFSWLSAAWVIPSVVGAPVAGWLTTVASWRWVFGVVVVPAVVASGLVFARRGGHRESRHRPSRPPPRWAGRSPSHRPIGHGRGPVRRAGQLAIHEREGGSQSPGAASLPEPGPHACPLSASSDWYGPHRDCCRRNLGRAPRAPFGHRLTRAVQRLVHGDRHLPAAHARPALLGSQASAMAGAVLATPGHSGGVPDHGCKAGCAVGVWRAVSSWCGAALWC
ncbi:MAG: MFS transporter [Actinomycetales bacterium]|nr:MFS transporter [Actinomycetales bacterium]